MIITILKKENYFLVTLIQGFSFLLIGCERYKGVPTRNGINVEKQRALRSVRFTLNNQQLTLKLWKDLYASYYARTLF